MAMMYFHRGIIASVLLASICHLPQSINAQINGTEYYRPNTVKFQSDEDPLFPGMYPLNLLQTIPLFYGTRVGVHFRRFDLEKSPGCDNDYVVIVERRFIEIGTRNTILWGPVCGHQSTAQSSFLNVQLIFEKENTHSEIFMVFSTNKEVRALGFSGNIYPEAPRDIPFDRVDTCTHTVTTAWDGWLRVNHDPFAKAHKSCNFRVTVPLDRVLQFRVIPANLSSCGRFDFYDVTGYGEKWLSTHYLNSTAADDVLSRGYDQVSVHWTPCGSSLLEDVFVNYTAVPRQIVERVHCTNGYVLFEGNCYKFSTFTRGLSWEQAESKCGLENGHLVSIQSRGEMRFLNRIINNHQKRYFATMCDSYYQRGGIFIGLKSQEKTFLFNWTDGSPYVYSEWYGPTIYGYDQYGVPDSLKAVFKEDVLQPVAQETLQCSVMMAFSPLSNGSPHGKSRWANWIKVPCHRPFCCMSSVCKKPATSATAHFRDENVSADVFNADAKVKVLSPAHELYCPDKWVYIEGRCLFLYTLSTFGIRPVASSEREYQVCSDSREWFLTPNMSMTYYAAAAKCASLKGHVASLPTDASLEVAKIQEYFSLWGKEQHWLYHDALLMDFAMESGGLLQIRFSDFMQPWIRTQRGTCAQGLGPMPTLEQEVSHCLNDSSTRSMYVLCETQPLRETSGCLKHQFQCNDGVCISIVHLCDGEPDCTDGEDEANCACDFGSFSCADNSCISTSKVCDHRPDCVDGSDESFCIHPPCRSDSFRCKNGQCVKQESVCDLTADCIDGSDESPENTCSCEKGFQCYTSECIRAQAADDRFPDCPGISQEDEIQDSVCGISVGYEIIEQLYCQKANDIRCTSGHGHCFPRHLACIHDKESYKALNVCRGFEHLQNCETYQCPSMFKCPMSYCIPLRQVCDGQEDCPRGEDEADILCSNFTCPGRFRCKGEKQCLHQRDVCNGVVDCILSDDDEKLCEIAECPNNCTCRGYLTDCSGAGFMTLPLLPNNIRSFTFGNNQLTLTNTTFSGYLMLIKLNISSNSLKLIPVYAFQHLNNLIELDISDNGIELLSDKTFAGLRNLKYLHLKRNPLAKIEVGAFSELNQVQLLDLSFLKIRTIYSGTFKGMDAITSLNISFNKLSAVQDGAFKGLPKLNLLDISGNEGVVVDTNAFDSFSAQLLKSDNFGICCLARNKIDNCLPKVDEFSSCYDLLKNSFLQVAVWVVGLTALFGNMGVLIYSIHVMYKGDLTTMGLYVTNLATANLLMGIYMITIGSMDATFRGRFAAFSAVWTSSATCQFAGCLSLLASQMAVTVLALIATDRLIAIAFSEKVPNISPKVAVALLLGSWVFWLILGVIPTTGIDFFKYFYVHNSVCLPFTLSKADFGGRAYSNAIYVVFNLIALVYICIAFIVRMRFAFKPQSHEDRSRNDAISFKGLSLIMISDLFCWGPATILGLVNVSGGSIAPDVSEWVAVLILTINSALNPLLFVIANRKVCRKTKRKPT